MTRGLFETINDYLDAIYDNDPERLAGIVSPGAFIACATDGTLSRTDREAYIERYAGKPPASSLRSLGRVISMDHWSPRAAVAIVEFTTDSWHFVECLNLVEVGVGWIIVSKIYHWQERTG